MWVMVTLEMAFVGWTGAPKALRRAPLTLNPMISPALLAHLMISNRISHVVEF